METAVEIPNFKLAKVGKERERRRGAIPLWFGGSGAGGSSLAVGGLAGAGAKIGVALLAAALGAGAYGLGKSMGPADSQFAAKKKPKLFASNAQRYEGDLSNIPSSPAKEIPNSLGMVSGSLDGKTPEQRAADQAAAEAAAKAEAERQAKADAEAQKQQPAASGEPAGVPGVDAAAIAAAAAGAQGADKANKASGPFSSRFGQLTSGLGSSSGLAGGAGLAGGVGRAFDTPHFPSKIGRPAGFGQGSKAGRSAARPTSVGQSHGRGLARKQLDKAFTLSQAARTGTGEARSSNASAAFENNPGANQAITGKGSGIGGITADSPGAGETPNPGGGSGSQPTQATASDAQTDDCAALFPDGGYMNSPSGGCVQTASHKNATPWQPLVKIAQVLTALAMALLLFAAIAATAAPAWFAGIAGWIGGIAAALGGIVLLMGIAMIGMGQSKQGWVFTSMGAILTAAGLIVALAPVTAQVGVEGQSSYVAASATAAAIAGFGGTVLGGVGLGVGSSLD